jgi:hypothetical protein
VIITQYSTSPSQHKKMTDSHEDLHEKIHQFKKENPDIIGIEVLDQLGLSVKNSGFPRYLVMVEKDACSRDIFVRIAPKTVTGDFDVENLILPCVGPEGKKIYSSNYLKILEDVRADDFGLNSEMRFRPDASIESIARCTTCKYNIMIETPEKIIFQHPHQS